MKIIKELVTPDPGQSFRFFTPRLKNNFFWHYHPEIELVYVESLTGIRHVGQHISGFEGSDLVLIGPNIPHLNFDYGLETDYMQIVVQLKENFLGTAFAEAPEMLTIRKLFDRAWRGLSFHGTTKVIVGQKLKAMHGTEKLEKLLLLIEIFEILAECPDATELNETDTSVKLFLNDKIRMGTVYQYINEHFHENVRVQDVSALVHLTTSAFCRYFKKHTKITFTDFVNQYRIMQARTMLLHDVAIANVCYACGFNNVSHFNKVFKKITGDTPRTFRARHSNKQAVGLS